MVDIEKDIRDDEFRVIGQSKPGGSEYPGKRSMFRGTIIAIMIVLAAVAVALLLLNKRGARNEPDEVGVFDSVAEEPVLAVLVDILGHQTDIACTERLDTVINDVKLSIYIPHNATPLLTVGSPDTDTRKAVLAFQAADIRRDNWKILGAFVLKGEPIAWGLSKKGFCAIIDSVITVGVSEDSPLFEKATEKGGYFFRQYPLVDKGTLVENEPKNKTMRKALCDRNGQFFVAVSETDESFHDFSQALVDLGVNNAINLVGSHSSFGWWKDASGITSFFTEDNDRQSFKNESYIVWHSSLAE